jgi:site-specific DNA-cytosine methylase
MRLLELFAGTQSISKIFRERGWTCTTVDFDPKSRPDICCDVLDLDPAALPRPDLIWASPLCTQYSRARTTAKTPRDLEGSDRLVAKVLELAAHWGVPFVMENPVNMLMHRDVVRGLPRALVSYCKYKDDRWGPNYRKDTVLYNTIGFEPSRPPCRRDCECLDEAGRHKDFAQRGGRKGAVRPSLNTLYSIPPLLCEDVERQARARLA